MAGHTQAQIGRMKSVACVSVYSMCVLHVDERVFTTR